MILFLILLIMAIILTVTAVIMLSVGGAAFLIVFGDIIICALLIGWIIKKLFFRK